MSKWQPPPPLQMINTDLYQCIKSAICKTFNSLSPYTLERFFTNKDASVANKQNPDEQKEWESTKKNNNWLMIVNFTSSHVLIHKLFPNFFTAGHVHV